MAGSPGSEQRRHVRIRHSGSVTIFAEGRTFSGQAVNISRTGMQVVVHMPESYREIRSLTFRLPSSNETFHVPCRLVRLDRSDRGGEETVLGVEISYQTEAQMLLIEGFIREMVRSRLEGTDRGGESRLLPRSACTITDVAADRPGLDGLSVDNISTDGLLLRFSGQLKAGDRLRLEFRLPGDERPLAVAGRVMYVIENDFQGRSAAGIALQDLSEVTQARIRNFVLTSASGAALKSLHERFSSRPLDHEFRITGRQRIGALFRTLADQRLTVNALFEGSLQIVELQVQTFDPASGLWTVTGQEQMLPALAPAGAAPGEAAGGRQHEGGEGRPGPTGFFSFSLNRGSHYFKAELLERGLGRLSLRLPSVLFRSEKRSHKRKSMPPEERVLLSLDPGNGEDLPVQGRLLDISRHGFLCEVPLTEALWERLRPAGGNGGKAGDGSEPAALHSGQVLRYSLRESLGLSHRGEIRHLSRAQGEDGGRVLRIGVEAGVVRDGYGFRRVPASRWNRRRLHQRPSPSSFRLPLPSRVVRYCNGQEQEICALVQFTREQPTPAGDGPAPAGTPAPGAHAALACAVVILPPAFGRRKEALAPLAATLLANFRHQGEDLVVVRYDGINRPGESHNDSTLPPRGYEMLPYRISQGLDDLRATLEYVWANPLFRPTRVVLVSCSMSALDARKLLAGGEQRVHLWVNLMGVASAQMALTNILGGLDIVGNAKMGVPNGINGLLGYLVNMDTLARDLIENRYAFLPDARQDMARIPVPVLWIYGTHDRWVVPEEIRDIMSIRSGAEREVLEIPTGHNLRTSEDALRTFMRITGYLFERLHRRRIAPREPDREMLLRLIGAERERLESLRPLPMEDYWRGYLLGNERNSRGYDFYRELTEFREFFDLEVSLLRPEEGGRIADMGCGTGLLEERILARLAAGSAAGRPAGRPLHLTAVDLVAEALERTRRKWEQAVAAHPALGIHRLECRPMNLEPNRLLAVRRFLDDPRLGYGYLHNRVEGLTAETLDRIARCGLSEVHRLMRGEAPDGDASVLTVRLAAVLPPEDGQAVLDFNRAARFLLRRLTRADLVGGANPVVQPSTGGRTLLEPELYPGLTTSAIRFERLAFGACGPELHFGFPEAAFEKIVASLFISYLYNPDDIFEEFHRALRPGGTLVVSSMKPDSDVSVIFTRYVEKMQRFDLRDSPDANRDRNLSAARAMLNEAAALFQLEEDGYFRFYTAEELAARLEAAGFVRPEAAHSLGHPPQAAIVTARKPLE